MKKLHKNTSITKSYISAFGCVFACWCSLGCQGVNVSGGASLNSTVFPQDLKSHPNA